MLLFGNTIPKKYLCLFLPTIITLQSYALFSIITQLENKYAISTVNVYVTLTNAVVSYENVTWTDEWILSFKFILNESSSIGKPSANINFEI